MSDGARYDEVKSDTMSSPDVRARFAKSPLINQIDAEVRILTLSIQYQLIIYQFPLKDNLMIDSFNSQMER